jgi:hypothetical protein
MTRTRGVCVILLLSLPWVGCSKVDTIGLEGEVTFDGQPVTTGTISFEPQDTNTGTFVATTVQDGKYALLAEKGVKPGFYRIRISAPDLSRAPPQAAQAEGSVVIPELIPAAWNANSEVTIEVTADGEHRFDFRIPRQ